MAKRQKPKPKKRNRPRRQAKASGSGVVAAGVAFWGALFKEAASYAMATNRELIALASGQMDARGAMLRFGDLGQRSLARLADMPRQFAETLGVEIPESDVSRRRPRRAKR